MDELIKKLQSAIDYEQQTKRVKELSPGLAEAIEIIKEHEVSTSAEQYEYEIKTGIWLEVKNKHQLKILTALGYFTRRKKN